MKVLITGASSGIGRDMAKVISKKADELGTVISRIRIEG